jgi:hypothetical protein
VSDDRADAVTNELAKNVNPRNPLAAVPTGEAKDILKKAGQALETMQTGDLKNRISRKLGDIGRTLNSGRPPTERDLQELKSLLPLVSLLEAATNSGAPLVAESPPMYT